VGTLEDARRDWEWGVPTQPEQAFELNLELSSRVDTGLGAARVEPEPEAVGVDTPSERGVVCEPDAGGAGGFGDVNA